MQELTIDKKKKKISKSWTQCNLQQMNMKSRNLESAKMQKIKQNPEYRPKTYSNASHTLMYIYLSL